MKPFTIKWWIRVLLKVNDSSENILRVLSTTVFIDSDEQMNELEEEYKNQYKLKMWIENRIINKYGEK